MLSITIVLVIDWKFSCKISKFVTKCQNGSWIFYNNPIPIYSTYWTYWWMTSNISSVSSNIYLFFFYCLAICFQFWWQTPRYLLSILWRNRIEKVYKKWDWFLFCGTMISRHTCENFTILFYFIVQNNSNF